ncbi:hypothetical protein VTL71DRAFT_4679 [Oculimacula yallundae]|uniref:Alpha-type protein kinase domain-containing protein n=1 Tax=Oculimacula yallundae TaxID=86028 RepID=A0ABR4C2P3_9HELO
MSNSRGNNSTTADIYTDIIFNSGTFKNVWEGLYTAGAREGQRCVAKEFKTGSVYEKSFFEEEMNVIRSTQLIIDHFADSGVLGNGRGIILNTPEIWTYDNTDAKVLIEPMIENYKKFNSNSGWASAPDSSSEAMQALSHFSYHDSNRQLLLCDLQGGIYQDDFILSDPMIMSQTQEYGPSDLGIDGINSFFIRHRCGFFCSRQWKKPTITGPAVIPMRQGSSMISSQSSSLFTRNPLAITHHLPAHRRPLPLSRLRE